MTETTKVEPKPENKAEIFAKEYEALCEKHGMRIVVSPVWVATNHNSFKMVNQYTVGALPEK